MNEPLWRPSEVRRHEANLVTFMAKAGQRWGETFSDYKTLYDWSIREPDKFWLSMWDFSGIVAATQGERVLINGDKMMDAKWFPDAQLNYAENLLRRRDDTEAIVFWGEARVRRR